MALPTTCAATRTALTMYISIGRLALVGLIAVVLAALGYAVFRGTGNRRGPAPAPTEVRAEQIEDVKREAAPTSQEPTQATQAPSPRAPEPRPSPAIDPVPAGATPADLFQSGAELIDRNSGESLGRSREELEAGIARIELAISKGFSDRRAAYRSLAAAYNGLQRSARTSLEERLQFVRKEAESYLMLSQIEPGNPEWPVFYASRMADDDPQAAITALLAAVSRHPRHMGANRLLGILLCRHRDRDSGLKYLKRAASAVASLPSEEASERGSWLLLEAHECAGEAGAEEVRAALPKRQ